MKKKHRLIQYNAPTTLTFALISFLVLLLGLMTEGASTMKLFCVYRSSLADVTTYIRFFGHVLGHSGYEHYMGNMLLLLLVGPALEEKYGSNTITMTIVVTALVTGLVQFLFFPTSALLGAIALLLCDLIGRLLFAPFELHVGIVLSVVGGIYFIFLILHRKGGRLS